MDATDQQLLSLLRKDARASIATLAQKLGVSRGTVTNRITRLEDAGIIVGYTVRLRPDAEPNEIHAWMSIAVEGNETRAVIASLLGEPGVASLHDTNGRWDLWPNCARRISRNSLAGPRTHPPCARHQQHRRRAFTCRRIACHDTLRVVAGPAQATIGARANSSNSTRLRPGALRAIEQLSSARVMSVRITAHADHGKSAATTPKLAGDVDRTTLFVAISRLVGDRAAQSVRPGGPAAQIGLRQDQHELSPP